MFLIKKFFKYLSKRKNLPNLILWWFKDYLDWNLISLYHKISYEFYKKWELSYLNLNIITKYRNISFVIDEFTSFDITSLDPDNTNSVIIFQNISNKSLNTITIYSPSCTSYYYKYKIPDSVPTFQVLEDNYVEKWKSLLDWDRISLCQNINKEFVEKYKDRINFDLLKQNIFLQKRIKDWFIAYTIIDNECLDYKEIIDRKETDWVIIYNYDPVLSDKNKDRLNVKIIKVKVLYKDLKTSNKASKVKIIRVLNNFKIKGKL